MRQTVALLVACFLATDSLTTSLQAKLIAADDFDYADACLTAGLNGGSGWLDAWTGENFITVGSLRFAPLPARGHKLTTSPAPGREATKCSYRTISAKDNDDLVEEGKFGRDGTTIWLGFLVNAPTGLSTGYGGLSLYNDDRQQVFLGDTGASDVYAIERTGQLQRFTTVRADAVIHFIICRLTFQAGDDKIDIWIDPARGSADPKEDSIAASAVVRDFRFNRIRLCSAPVPLNFDNLRLATKFADLAGRDDRSSPVVISRINMGWGRLLALGLILAVIGAALMLILLWAFSWKKRREPPLVR